MTGSRPRGMSVRVKLALSYAGFLVIAGIAMFVVGFLLLRFVPDGDLSVAGGSWAPNRGDLLEVFVKYAWWAMGLLVVFGLAGGWLLAGVVLRPLGRITDAAARARDGDLAHRVDLAGNRDELTDLADTLDAMLDRIERTIDEERRFAANASHELRTPHAIIRTIVEVAQADPSGRDVDAVLRRIGATNERAIASTEALLTLGRVGRGGTLEVAPVELAEIVSDAVDDVRTDAAARSIRIETSLPLTIVTGNRVLLAQLVANLIGNAITHNVDGGWIRISLLAPRTLLLENSGPVLTAELAARLTEPFVRGQGRSRSVGDPDGAGLGLAIVASIARAHSARLTVAAVPSGGLQVRVALPR